MKMTDAKNTESRTVGPENQAMTYNDIAMKLLKDKFLLTALELHMELSESGREVKQLRDFFSNPGNFEFATQEIPSSMSRSGSQATLDSLDLTRYSEDGAGTDEKVAVLEFELRKAKETINALRNNLTVATESETSTPERGSLRNLNMSTIKPHEQRALNFLINEYLLLNSYKLTSITFADENQHQDFDDWDDVGLNIAKPPELLIVYREYFKQTALSCVSSSTQTEFVLEDDASRKSEESVLRTLDETLEYVDLKDEQTSTKTQDSPYKTASNSKDSLESESTSEKFEIIDTSMSLFKKSDSVVTAEDNISNHSFNVNDWTNLTMTIHDNNVIDTDLEAKNMAKEINIKLFHINISEDTFKKEVFSLCYVNIPQKVNNEILDDILNRCVTNDSLVHILSLSLLKIIPNIILNKREDVIPLVVSAVHLNTDSSIRDKLLQQLFNLKKRPSDTERMMILTGIVSIARFSGEYLVENEILPQCWEQLTNKYVEKRLLVGEACTALIPYVSSQIRNSLLLSILQQLLDDREETVRETVVRALSLVMALCDDPDKYFQCEELAFNTLMDRSPNIVNLSTQILFPVLARWALSDGRLNTHLIKHLLYKLNDYLKDDETVNKMSNKISNLINVLEKITPFLLISVSSQDVILSHIEKDATVELRSDLAQLCSSLTNPSKFQETDYSVAAILWEFDRHLNEHPDADWPEMNWLTDMMLPDLLNSLTRIDTSHHVLVQNFISLFTHLCVIFGRAFTKVKIRPIFQTKINNLEQMLANYNQFYPNLNLIPVYLVSVLSYCNQNELSNVLTKFLCILPLCGGPLDCLEITVKGLCEKGLQELVVASLWKGVVHQKPLVRAVTAHLFSVIIGSCDKNLLRSKVTPGLVTLTSDSDVIVKTAAIPALSTLVSDCDIKELHDKVYMQIQSFLAEPSLRDNHTLLRQLIVTLGSMAGNCSIQFRHEVILPHLSSLSTFVLEMSNQTRKVDMAHALIDAFTTVTYIPSTRQDTHDSRALIMPGLKCLEIMVAENHSLISYRDAVLSMIRECEESGDFPMSRSSLSPANKLGQNVNESVEEVKQRVNKIFRKQVGSKPNPLPNLQGIFKKK